MKWIGAWVLVGATVGLAKTSALADEYPSRPVRLITAGAGTFHDIVSRQLGQQLSKRWGQPVVVENQPAAGLTVGTGMAARAVPDGYTLVMSDRSALAVAPSLLKGVPYDVSKDFMPVTLAALAPSILVAHPSVPAATMTRRFPGAADIPTAAEVGLSGLDLDFWIGVLAPARTAQDIVVKLNRDIGDVLRQPDMQAVLQAQGALPAPGSSEGFATYIAGEASRMRDLVQRTGMRAERWLRAISLMGRPIRPKGWID